MSSTISLLGLRLKDYSVAINHEDTALTLHNKAPDPPAQSLGSNPKPKRLSCQLSGAAASSQLKWKHARR